MMKKISLACDIFYIVPDLQFFFLAVEGAQERMIVFFFSWLRHVLLVERPNSPRRSSYGQFIFPNIYASLSTISSG